MLAALALLVKEHLPEIAKVGAEKLLDQVKDPAMKQLGLDPVGKAVTKANEAFVGLFQAEYNRCDSLSTLFGEATIHSLKTFLSSPEVQYLLAQPLKDGATLDVGALSRLWPEITDNGQKLVPLPAGFNWSTLGNQYLVNVRDILAETPELRAIWTANNVDEIKRLLQEMHGVRPQFSLAQYRDALLEDCSTLKVSRLRIADSISLNAVYVPPRLLDLFPAGPLSPTDRGLPQAGSVLPPQTFATVIDDPSARKLVIVGDPGLGKSTLVQKLMLDWASGRSSAIPFQVQLRHFALDHARPKDFLAYFESGTWRTAVFRQTQLDRYLREEETIFLLDGLDEIEEPLRGNLVAQIVTFSRTYPRCCVVVTTRSAGYAVGASAETLRNAGFRSLALQEFDYLQVQEFVRKWYAARLPGDPRAQEEAIRQFWSAIGDSNSMRALTGNPLLLTMMVQLNLIEPIPRRREELYDSCVGLMLEDREPSDDSAAADLPGRQEKTQILQTIALAIKDEPSGLAGNMIAESKLRATLEKTLKAQGDPRPIRAADRLLAWLSERDLMLCSRGAKQYGFAHRTFLEYFCAKAYQGIQEGGDPSKVIELFRTRWRDPNWDEVLRLICGIAGSSMAATLLGELLAAAQSEIGWRAVLMAADCFLEVRRPEELSAERDALRSALMELFVFDYPYPYTQWDEESRLAFAIRSRAIERTARCCPDETTRQALLVRAARDANPYIQVAVVGAVGANWEDETTLAWLADRLANDGNFAVRQAALRELARIGPRDRVHEWLINCVTLRPDGPLRLAAVGELAARWPDEATRKIVLECATRDPDAVVRQQAVAVLAWNWPDEATRRELENFARGTMSFDVRSTAVLELARRWSDTRTRRVLQDLARNDPNWPVRHMAAGTVAQIWHDEEARRLLQDCALSEPATNLRPQFLNSLAQSWPDTTTRDFLFDRWSHGETTDIRKTALQNLLQGWRDFFTRGRLAGAAATDEDPLVRQMAISLLARFWPDPQSRTLVLDRAAQDEKPEPRQAAVNAIARVWPADSNREWLLQRAVDDAPAVRSTAMVELARGWRDDAMRQWLTRCATTDASGDVRGIAVSALVRGWPDIAMRRWAVEIATPPERTGVDVSAFAELASTVESWSAETVMRRAALVEIARAWPDDLARAWFVAFAAQPYPTVLRSDAIAAVAWLWPDDVTRQWLQDLVQHPPEGPQEALQVAALAGLGRRWHDEANRVFVLERLATHFSEGVRVQAITSLAEQWKEEATREKLLQYAQAPGPSMVRMAALRGLGLGWHDEATMKFLRQIASQQDDYFVWQQALTFAYQW